jgi:hypothetical protein
MGRTHLVKNDDGVLGRRTAEAAGRGASQRWRMGRVAVGKRRRRASRRLESWASWMRDERRRGAPALVLGEAEVCCRRGRRWAPADVRADAGVAAVLEHLCDPAEGRRRDGQSSGGLASGTDTNVVDFGRSSVRTRTRRKGRKREEPSGGGDGIRVAGLGRTGFYGRELLAWWPSHRPVWVRGSARCSSVRRRRSCRSWAARGEGEMGLREWEPKGGLGVDFYFKTSFPFSFSKLFYKYFYIRK